MKGMMEWLHMHWLRPEWIFIFVKLAKVLAFPAVGGGGWLARRWWLSRSKYWPIVQGRVVSIMPGVDGSMCNVSYVYVVDGEYYSGEIPFFRSLTFRRKEDVHAALPKDMPIDVRYRPGHPEKSVAIIPEMVLQGGFVRAS